MRLAYCLVHLKFWCLISDSCNAILVKARGRIKLFLLLSENKLLINIFFYLNWKKKFVERECGKLEVFCYGLGLDPIILCT